MHILILFSLLLMASFVSAEELPFTHYTPQDVINPLPSSDIQQTLQDSQGYLWFVAYSSGLVRYDGRVMTLYTPAHGLPDVAVTALAQTPEGYLWAGGEFGLAVSDQPLADYSPGEAIHFTATPQGVALSTSTIYDHNSFTVDHNGALWVGTATAGLWRYQYQDKKLQIQQFSTDLFGKKQHATVSAVTGQTDGTVWATIMQSATSYTLIGLVPESNQIEKVAVLPIEITALQLQGKSLWLGALDGRLWRYQLDRRTLTPLPQFSEGEVEQLWSGPGSILWVLTKTGIYQFDTQTMKITSTISQTQGLLSDFVHHAMQDHEGNLWLAQLGGISKLPHDYRAFGYYTASYHSQQPPALPITSVRAVLPSGPRQSLWIGTKKGLVNTQVDEAITKGEITTLCKGKQDDLWFGTAKSVYHLAPAARTTLDMRITERLALFDQPHTLEQFALNNRVNNCLQQSFPSDQNILWLSAHRYLYALLFETTTHGPRWFSFGAKSGLPHSSKTSLALDASATLWVGTLGKGLFRSTHELTPQDFKNFATKPDEVIGKHVGTNVFTRAVLELNGIVLGLLWHQKVLWVGTDRGLVLVDTSNVSVIRRLTTDNGLQHNAVVSLAADPTNNHVWIGTNNGLAEIDAKGERVLRTFTRKDGLVGAETMWLQSVAVDANGTVYMGSDQGVTRYSAKFHHANTIPPKMVFRSIRFQEAIDGTNSAIFQYAALSFANEHQNRFKTRLLGYDPDWSIPVQENKRNYTNLAAYFFPKSYTFEIIGSNNDGVWSQPIRYQFLVQPAWWLRWWVVLLFAFLAITSGYILHRSKIHKQTMRIIQLQQLDKMKDEFLANTSHELRTPLNGIIGIVESLLDGVGGPLSEVTKKNLQLVEQSGRRLSHLVDDVLDTSTLQKGTLVLQTQPVSLYKLVDGVLLVCQSLVGDKTLKLENRITQDLPLVEGDEKRLLQVFYNLVGNAIKFTHAGVVTVSAERHATFDKVIEVRIEDTGIGIPADKLEIIFNAFEQVDASTARVFGGTGLGLHVTRQLVELHGGTIIATATLERGSCFSFTLPISNSQVEADMLSSHQAIAKINAMNATEMIKVGVASPATAEVSILVVDDELINRQVITNHLSTPNHHLLLAEDGMQALTMLNNLDVPPDLVLLDVMMPMMSGYEVCTTLRKDYTANQLPIVMLTAKNQLSDLLQGFASGANDYLTKPFSKQELLARVKAHIEVAKLSRQNGDLITRLQDINQKLEHSNEELNQESQARSKIQMDLYLQETQMDETIAQRTAELAAANVKSQQESQAKGCFLANMSHEIRTPLTAIIGFGEVMKDEHVGKDTRGFELAAAICRNGEHLLYLINDILDFSKIEAQRLEIERIPCDIVQILDDVRLVVAQKAKEKAVDFIIDLTANPPTQIISDPTRIKQILINLCNNAIKFTEKGEVRLSVHQNVAARMLYFDVEDSGIGMTAEQVGSLFQAFCQAEATTARRYGGTGLGLAISKQLAHMLGGTIAVTSEAGVGSCFHLSIHLETADECDCRLSPAVVETNIEPGKQKVEGRILVAEDNPDNQTLIQMLIQKTGADLTIVDDGQQVLAKIQTEDFDLLLIDIYMPVMGGEEVIKIMRAAGIDKPIYALTANVMQQEIDHYLAIGFTGHVAKPIDRLKFYQIIYQNLKCLSPELKAIDDLKCLNGRILLAEDNVYNRDMLRRLVEKTNAKLTVVENGMLAVEQAVAEDFDLILMDLQMPGMGGEEAVEALRKLNCTKPIVVLTANVMEHEIDGYLKIGCNDVLAKPIDRKKFYEVLQTYLKQGDEEKLDDSIADEDEWTERDPVYRELLAKFTNKNLPKMLEKIEHALAEGDRSLIKFSAHTLKGTGGNFGFFELADLAAKLCDKAESAPLEELDELLQAMYGVSGVRKIKDSMG